MYSDDVKKIAVLGTGIMGHGIAMLCAMYNYEVSMYGRSEDSLERGFQQVRSGLDLLVKNNILDMEMIEPAVSRIKGETSLARSVAEADVIIEAIVEDLEIKQELYRKIDAIAPVHTIFASNTSGLSPTLLAAATDRPDRVIVTHFWNPPYLLPLVEIVPGEKTSADTQALAKELILKLGKKPVVVKDIPGFIGNRLQFALLREALYIVEQGWASMEDVDAAVKYSFGRRLAVTGPLESADLGGLDVFYCIQTYLNKELCNQEEPSILLKEKVSKGELGAKKLRGLYDWRNKDLKQIKHIRERHLVNQLKEDITGKN